jgi:hypothetical protein
MAPPYSGVMATDRQGSGGTLEVDAEGITIPPGPLPSITPVNRQVLTSIDSYSQE